MPPIVRRYLRTAIAFLAAGLVIGLWLLVEREFAFAVPPRALSAHTHLLLVGFVLFMICGVALWMFPRAARDDARYQPQRAEWAYWLMMPGTAARAALELLSPAGAAGRWLTVIAGVAQVAGLLLFFVTILPRIRSTLSAPR